MVKQEWLRFVKKKRRLFNSFLISLVVAGAVSCLWLFPSLHVVEEPLSSMTTRTVRGKTGCNDIAIVLIQDTDQNSRTQAIPYLTLTRLVKRLNQEMAPDTNGSPRILLFDYFYFFGSRGWKEKESLEKALRDFKGKVVFSGLALAESKEEAEKGMSTIVRPTFSFAQSHPIGIANIPVSPDGMVYYVHWDYHKLLAKVMPGVPAPKERHGIPALLNQVWDFKHEEKYWTNHWADLGVAAYLLEKGMYGKTDPDVVIPESENRSGETSHKITLRYPYLPGKGMLGGFFPMYSVKEVLDNKLISGNAGTKETPDQVLRKAHIVFVGDARTVRQAQWGTPAGPIPGVLIHAVVLWDLLESRFAYPVSFPIQSLVILLMSLAPACFLNIYVMPRPSFAWMGEKRKVPLIFSFFIFVIAFALFDFYVVHEKWALNLGFVFPIAASLFSFTGISFYRSVLAEKETSKIVELLSRYLSPELAEGYRQNPDDLGLSGRLDQVTVIFCDVRGFTAASEKLPPREVVQAVKEYYDAIGSIIISKEGFLAKFIGDAIMGVFSEPRPRPDDPVRALEAALLMLQAIESLNARWGKGGRQPWKIGIGINTGEAVWGAMGFKDKEELTIIGDAVNVASRLQELTKEYQVPVILSQTTYEALGPARKNYELKSLGQTSVRGRDEKISIWTTEGKPDDSKN